MNVADWLSLTLICILGATSPGPSLAVILAASRLRGRGGGCAAAIGHGTGVFLYALMAASSLSYILAHYDGLFQSMQIIGSLVLMWIGARLFLAGRLSKNDISDEVQAPKISRSFCDGFIIAIFNPKIAAFFVSLFSLYLKEGQTGALHVTMAALAGGIDAIVYLSIVLVATTGFFKITFAKYADWNDLILGGVLMCFAVLLLVKNITSY